MRKFTTRIYTKANYLLNRGRMALSNQRGDFYISDAVKIIIAVLSCSRFSSACKPCVWIYSTDQRKIPVCLRQMAGLQCLCQCS